VDYRKIDLRCPGAGRVSFRNACVSVPTLYRMPNFLFADDPDGAVHRVGSGATTQATTAETAVPHCEFLKNGRLPTRRRAAGSRTSLN